MATTNWKDILLPGVNDPLIETLEESAGRLNTFITVANPDAATLLLDDAAANGAVITSTDPVLFRIGSPGVWYECGGRDGNQWQLTPVNEVEPASDTYEVEFTGSKRFTAPEGNFQRLMRTSLPARAYDRTVSVDCAVWGRAVSGNVDLQIQLHGGGVRLYRFATDDTTVGGHAQCVIPAGEPPEIVVGVRGGAGGGVVELSATRSRNTLDVQAFPKTMA